jgi:transposase
MAVDTMGSLLSLLVTAGNLDDRKAVLELYDEVQVLMGEQVEVAFVDQGYTGGYVRDAANQRGVELLVVSKPGAVKGFVLLPRRWVVERLFGWVTRFRRLARDFERLPEVFAGLHFLVFGILLLAKFLRGLGTPTN